MSRKFALSDSTGNMSGLFQTRAWELGWQTIIWINGGIVYWHMDMSFSLKELTLFTLVKVSGFHEIWPDKNPQNIMPLVLKEARYKIIQNDRFSWKKSCTNISLWWFWIYQNDIRLPCYFFCYMHFKVTWNSILALKSAFIYDVIISCLKAWYIQLTSKNWFFSKDNYFYLHKSYFS